MPLDNKLQRKRLASDTYKDDMSADKTESPLNTLVPVLAASAGLYAMYKKGMLQPLVKSGMEVFESVAKNSTDKAHTNLKSIKEWTKFENLSPDKLKEIGYRVPKDSIFRGKGINKIKSLGLDTISEIEKGDIRLGYARKIINDTVEDVNQLRRLIEENTKRADAYRQKYYDSDLITGMKELRKFSREVNANNPNARLFVNEKATQEFINMHTLSQEEEKRLLKINGYRPVMLQDIMEAPEKVQLDEGSKYIYKAREGAKINLKDNTGTQVYNSADELLGVMGSSDFRYMNKSGKTTNMIGDWENTKRLILDKNILIDESGNLIDLRISDEMLKGIKESITKDFQIPGLGFNPLTSLFPSWTNARIRKPSFGILSKNSIQPFITGEAGQKFLGEDLFVLNGKAFKMTNNGLEQVTDNIVLNDISRAGQYGLNKRVETARKMANLNYYDFKLKDNIQQEIDSGSLKGKFYSYLDKVNKWLDSGKPDNYIHKARFNPDGERIDIDNEWAFNPDIDSFLTNKIHKLTSKFNMYEAIDVKTPENIFGNGPKDIVNEITNSTESSRKFIATRKGISISDLKEQEGIENKISFTKDYLGQFFAGRNKDGTISNLTTETSLRAYGLFDNVFGRLNAIAPQLGFGTESKGSLPEYIKNIALKRVLPIYVITQAPEMLNTLSEPIFNLFDKDEDGTGNKNNITKFITSNIVKPLDLGMHKVKDILGITKLNKKIEEFTPGFDQINELPGIYHLGLNQTYEEREDYIENGYDPIRKARYWGMGNTPFTGGKIMYWRPNLYRRIEADVDFSDSKWGSRQEYYSNTWYPNPVNPLAPINHFILDRNHYDKKHYQDRPYLLTSKEGNNIPIVGPLYSATVGNIINPQKRMHEEYWENNKPVERNDENVAIVDYVNQATLYQRQMAYNNAFINSNTITSISNTYRQSQSKDGYARAVSSKQAQEVVQYNSSPQNVISGNILPTQTDNTFSSFVGNLSNLEIYTTPSGNTSLVDIPDTLTTWDANQRLREYSIKRFPEADSRVELKDENKFNPQLVDYTNEKINNAFIYNAGEEFNTLADFFGMKGFETQAFITGEANVGAKTIEDSNYAYSFNKSFWDENLGGFGGDASEIFRRFVQKRNTSTEYINPIRNTMPSWMPGRNYFTDFKHGDAYCLSKDTLVLTDKGYIEAENVKIGDIILTNKGNHYPVQNIAIRPIETNEKSYRLTISGIDKKIPLEFSENHPILVKHLFRGIPCGGKCKPCLKDYKYDCNNCKSNKWNKTSLKFVKTKDIKIGDAVVFPIPVINNPITNLNYQYEWQDAPRSPKYIKKGSLTITKDIAWLLGLYLAEGSTAKQNHRPVRLLFTLHSSEIEVADKVCNILENTFGKRPEITFRKEYDCLEIVLCDAQIARIFNDIIPGNLYEKRIPKEFYHSTKENMINLLLGFMLGDGSIQRNYVIGTTANQQLAFDLHRLSMYAGIPCQIIERNTRESYEICIHSFNLKDIDLSGLMYKQDKLDFNYTRIPGLLTYTDGQYIYSEITDKQEINLDYVYGFEVDIDDTFCVIGFATHNTKIDNGEERLPGEGYERLAGINTKKMFDLGIGSSYIGKSKEDIQKHLLNQDTMDSFGIDVTESGTKAHEQIEKAWLESGLAINTEGKIQDKQNNILGYYDALIHDRTSKTGKAIVDIKTVSDKKFNRILQQGHPEFEHQSQTNYYLWATGNKRSNGYIYYVNRDNPEQTFTMGFKFDKDLLQQNLNTLNQARNEIYTGLENGTIGRGELYSNLDRYRILADVAPYSDEFQSIKARLANDPNLTKEEQREISQINERIKQQKEPLRVYPYKFKTSNLQNERVTVKKVLDNNTLLVSRYGVDHAVKFAGIHISESNTDKYDKNTTMNEAAAKELKKYVKRGKTITIGYDYDEANKFKKDSTESIRAVVYSKGKNVNQIMLNKGLATEKDEDESPAAIHARYTKNEIAVGSAMERITHAIGQIPFIGNKLFQVKSPYEQYRDREVYGKDFQSWNNPIRDYLGPEMIDKVISHGNKGPSGIVTSTVLGTFLGSLFGGSKFGKMIGGFVGGTIGLVGGTYANTQKTKDKDWLPERREKQAELNEYFDTLKYVKNMSLYEKYKEKALKENHIDVTKLEGTKELQGIYNKNKTNELKDFKKVVKLDYKHRKQFDFKYGAPETLDMNADAKSIIKSINQELTKIQSDRSVERVPENIVKAISYKQQADQTMYGYNVGDPLNNLMKALPKKERQYFKYFMKAPEEEKDKILRIAPEYLRRGLQQAWGMEVDEKPNLQEYFQTHGLPDASWIGWDESTNIEDVKVKLVHNNKLDMGEFDLWNDQINQANQSYIPVPKIRSQNSNRMVQLRLQSILGKAGYEDAVVTPYFNAKGNKNTLNVYQDSRDDISNAIYNLDI